MGGNFESLIANEEFWSSLGYWILIAGLVGDIVVLVVPKHREPLEKILALVFTIIIIVGVAIEHRADAAISVLVSRQQMATGLQMAHLIKEAADARKTAGDAEKEAGKANERAANIERESLLLQEQLIAQGSRSSLLYGKRRNRLIEQLKPFAGQKVEIRFCRESWNQYFIDQETIGVAMLLEFLLSDGSKWLVNPLAMANYGGTGLMVEVNSKAPGSTRKAADALLKALKEVPLTAVGGKVYISDAPRPPQMPTFEASGKEVHLTPLGVDTIVITVLAHPL